MSSPLRPRRTEDDPTREMGSSSRRDFRSLSDRSALPYSSPEWRSVERFTDGETEFGERVPLRDALIRTLRGRGAGVIKSLGWSRASDSALWLFDKGDPSRENLDAEDIAPMRTTLGAGLPSERSCGEAFRGDWLCCLELAADRRSYEAARRLGEEANPSPSKRAFTDALNLGSGTSSSELSPPE